MKKTAYSLFFLIFLFTGCFRITGSGGVTTKTTKTYTLSGNFETGQSVYAIFTGTDVNKSSDYGNITVNGNISKNIVGPESVEIGTTRIDIGSKLRENVKDIKLNKEISKSISKSISNSKTYIVNDEETFNVEITRNDYGTYPSYSTTTSAILIDNSNEYSGKRLNVWLDKGNNNSSNRDIAIALGDTFLNGTNTNDIYHWITKVFGEEWGEHDFNYLIKNSVNTNNDIHIILTDLNEVYDNYNYNYVMGYFNPLDTVINGTQIYNQFGNLETLKTSNQMNIFYIDVRLLTGIYTTNKDKTEMKRDIYSTLAHEFVHMINWYQKDVKLLKLNNFTETWLNEMLAMMGEDLVDDKIIVDDKEVDGSKMRIPSFNLYYNNYDINDKDSIFDEGDYAINGVYGLYLIRAYGYNNLDFLKNIMHNSYTGTSAIDFALNKFGSKKTFIDTVKDFGKAVILSSTDAGTWGASTPEFYMNRTIDNYLGYVFEPIDLFNKALNKGNSFTYKATQAGFKGGANTYAELRNENDNSGSERWTFSVPLGVDVQFVVKNSNGSFNPTKTSELNNNVIIN